MSLFLLTFKKEVSVSVEAESEELLRKAANDACDDLDYNWDTGDWDYNLINVNTFKPLRPECKLVDGEILNYEDCLEKV